MKNKLLDRIKSDSHFRLFLIAGVNGGWNFIYAVFNLVLAAVYKSWWFVTLGVYYFFLSCMRETMVAHGKSARDRRRPETVVRHVGIVLALLSIVFAGTVLLSITENHSTGYNMVVMLAIAAYTFYLFTMAVINIVKSRKSGDIKTVALRNISLGGAFVSMFSLEKSMLATFTEDDAEFVLRMETASGAVIFAVLIALGVALTVGSGKNEENAETD